MISKAFLAFGWSVLILCWLTACSLMITAAVVFAQQVGAPIWLQWVVGIGMALFILVSNIVGAISS